MDRKDKTIPGSIGEEIQRLLRVRGENGEVPIMLTSLAISFTQFVFGLLVFGVESEEMPTIADVWTILNGGNFLERIRLMHSIQGFLSDWLDSKKPDDLDWEDAVNIADAYNRFVKKQLEDTDGQNRNA